MFVYSMKATTIKFFGVIALALVTLIVLIAFIEPYEPVSAGDVGVTKINYGKIKDSSDVKRFLSQFGWTVSEEPIESVVVGIPDKFDRVISEYNEIQKMQGLNLEKYKGKDVTRYTFVVQNYSDIKGSVYANVLVYKKKVIGGDICAADVNGFIHGFEKTE